MNDKNSTYQANIHLEFVTEIWNNENFFLNLLTPFLVYAKVESFTRDFLWLSEGGQKIAGKLLFRKNKGFHFDSNTRPWKSRFDLSSFSFPEREENIDFDSYWKYLDFLSDLVSSHIAKLYDLSSDLFLYSLSRDSKKIQSIKEELSSTGADCWKALEKNVVLPVKNIFKNIEIYDTGLKDFEVQPILIHKNLSLYYKNRGISLLSQFEKIKSKVAKITGCCDTRELASFDPSVSKAKNDVPRHPNIPIDRLALILNPFDYEDFQKFIEPSGKCMDFSDSFNNWKEQGMTIYKHESVKPGDFIILEQGTFLLVNLLSLFKKGNSFPQMGFYEDTTAPSVSFGIGCYCIGKNVCLPMHYQEESYEQINFLSLRKTKWYFLYTWNNPKFRESCMKILLLSLPPLYEILKNRFAGSS